MNRRRLIALALAGLIALSATRVEAFLGIGDVVFDPSVYAQALEQVARLERQLEQLIKNYELLRNQYEQMQRNARMVPVDMDRRYRAVATPWTAPQAGNTYGTTAAWLEAVRTGVDVRTAFQGDTEPLAEYGAAFGSIPADQQRALTSVYGTVELTDGVTQTTLETIGRLRAHSAAVQGALLRLEDDSLSRDPQMNTEVAVLNKMNASGLIALRSAQDTNSLLIALAEQQAVAAKRTRDAEARAINQHIRFVTDAKAPLVAQSTGVSDALRAWRMP